jgi:hypothetical protein
MYFHEHVLSYDVRHVARVACKCCVHLMREERATRDVTFGPLCRYLGPYIFSRSLDKFVM